MEKSISMSDTKKSNLLLYLSTSVLFILVVSFIDEGANSFEWMNNPLDWISFFAFVGAIFLGQVLVEKIILKNYTAKGKTFISILGGIVLGLLCFFVVTYIIVVYILVIFY